MKSLLFERFWLLLVLLAGMQFVTICLWSWRRSRGTARAVWAGFIAVPLFLIINSIVVTSTEQVIRTCRDLARSLEAGNVDEIAHHLAGDIQVDGLTRQQLVERLRATLLRRRIVQPKLSGFEVRWPEREAAIVIFDAFCTVSPSNAAYDRLFTRWKLTMRRGIDGWEVSAIKALPAPLSPIRAVRDLF